jgi:hypothetical protein
MEERRRREGRGGEERRGEERRVLYASLLHK